MLGSISVYKVFAILWINEVIMYSLLFIVAIKMQLISENADE